MLQMSERTQTLDKERDSVRAQLESLQAERQRLKQVLLGPAVLETS